MNTTERAIMEQLAQLNDAQQQQLLAFARQLVEQHMKPTFDLGSWLSDLDQFHRELQVKHGKTFYFNSQDMLDELREEESQ